RKLTAGEVRRDFIHSHGVVLQAIGRAGSALIKRFSKSWPKKLGALAAMDWSRNNPEWEGRAMIGGRVSKSSQNVSLTCNAIKQRLGLDLTAEETRLEEAYLRGGGKTTHV
ncbi:DNA sulfur modification protein DndB, partial [bacterium]|nr:DNA sulfur modification protein DndB [bacterium]